MRTVDDRHAWMRSLLEPLPTWLTDAGDTATLASDETAKLALRAAGNLVDVTFREEANAAHAAREAVANARRLIMLHDKASPVLALLAWAESIAAWFDGRLGHSATALELALRVARETAAPILPLLYLGSAIRQARLGQCEEALQRLSLFFAAWTPKSALSLGVDYTHAVEIALSTRQRMARRYPVGEATAAEKSARDQVRSNPMLHWLDQTPDILFAVSSVPSDLAANGEGGFVQGLEFLLFQTRHALSGRATASDLRHLGASLKRISGQIDLRERNYATQQFRRAKALADAALDKPNPDVAAELIGDILDRPSEWALLDLETLATQCAAELARSGGFDLSLTEAEARLAKSLGSQAMQEALGEATSDRDLPTGIKRQASVAALVGTALSRKALASGKAWMGLLRLNALPAKPHAGLIELMIPDALAMKGLIGKLVQQAVAAGAVTPELRLKSVPAETRRISYTTLARILRRDVPADAETLLAHIKRTPIGVGTVAEVYSAVASNGAPVAVKVLYPGIRKVIAADVGIFRTFAPLARQLFPTAELDRIIDEIERRVVSETDLLAEAQIMRDAKASLKDLVDVSVPGVRADLSGGDVLTMEHMPHEWTWEAFVAHGSAEAKRRAARSLLRLYFHSVFRSGLFFGDPHPRNLLVDHEGRIALLDWGGSASLDKASQAAHARRLVAIRDADLPAFRASIIDEGIVVDQQAFKFEDDLRMYRDIMAPLFSLVPVRIDHAVAAKDFNARFVTNPNRKVSTLPPALVAPARSYQGILALIADLAVEDAWGEVYDEVAPPKASATAAYR